MSKGPRILISNDDGINAVGIKHLQEIAAQISDDVWVVAPQDNQSGAGHRFTLGTELSLEQIENNIFAIDGTPADCVVIACTHILKDKKPDIILSGINHGQNLGDIIHCSGTLAAAREGALQGALGIGLSQAYDYMGSTDINWDCAIDHGADIVRALIKEHHGNGTYYNVNFPIAEQEREPDVQIVPHQRFSTSPFSHYASKNEGKFFVTIPKTPLPLDEGHDFHALHHEHSIIVTPLLLQQSDAIMSQKLQGKIKLGQQVK
ncbi:MAG: 5'/3'-nucleotidase SurE [Devosiaceae bacterium]|nr:5'/3'-nucleotidase SurE [Devosiaceae bacterium]